MKITATKKATSQFQRMIDMMGTHGGKIKTDASETWWDLEVEVIKETKNGKWVFVGISKVVGNNVIFDPVFSLVVTMKMDKVETIKIREYISETALGRFYIDGEDVVHCAYCPAERDSVGMKKRFSQFMNTVAEFGPYLDASEEIIKYEQPIEHSWMLQKFM